MTRETKLGLIVGTSFLSLAGVVAYTTLRKGDEQPPMPPQPQAPIVAQNTTPPKKGTPEPGILPVKGQLDNQPVVPAAQGAKSIPPGGQPTPGSGPGMVIPPPTGGALPLP